MSWAALVKKEPAAEASNVQEAAQSQSKRVAIVDANAIISGLRLTDIADRYMTIQEVLDECRDKQSRQFLASLPFTLEVKEPDEESITAVTSFARLTGDLHALSKADIKLLALAYSKEVENYGVSHLRTAPVQASFRPKHRSKAKGLPGWGTVPNPQDWAAIDALDDEAGGTGQSRIRTAVQQLNADPVVQASEALSSVAEEAADQAKAADVAANEKADIAGGLETSKLQFSSLGEAAAAMAASSQIPDAGAEAWFSKPAAETAGVNLLQTLLPPPSVTQGTDTNATQQDASTVADDNASHLHDEHDEDDYDEDGDEWAVAGKSRAAERRKRRNHARYLARQAARQSQLQDSQSVVSEVTTQAVQQQPQVSVPETQPAATGSAVPSSNGDQVQGDGEIASHILENLSQSEDESEEEGSEGDDDGIQDEIEGTEADGDQATETVSVRESVAASGTDCGELQLNTTSCVCCVTSDFPMQNVLLQMGLRLVSRDGKQINRLSRWAIRCSACFFVTKEAGRMFCPRCGNMTMERVEVAVGPEGAEVFGVRKKHVLRGTRFSLPKPKGGRAKNPILREDEMLHRLKPRKQKKAADVPADPFAPEYDWGNWQQNNQNQMSNIKGTAYLLASHKHNPNERKNHSSNRRRK